MVRMTHTSIEKTRNELANNRTSINMLHTAFLKGTEFGYAATIMTSRGYLKKVISLELAWTFTKPTKTVAYDLIIKTSNVELLKPQKEAAWEF